MKKVILLMLVAVLGAASASAQFEKGVKRIKAQATGLDFNFSDKDVDLTIGAEASYFLATNVALKAGIGFDWDNVEDKDATSTFHLTVGSDYYFYRMLYGGVALDFRKVKGIDFETAIQLEIGATYYIVDNVYINPAIYFNSGLGTSSSARFGLGLGLGVNF